VAACSRDRGPETGSTTVTGAPTGEAKPVTVEEVRVAILDQNPKGPETLSTVVIMTENNAVTLKGTVPDEETRANMVNRVKRMPSVKSVRDEMTVAPKGGSMQGSTTTPSPMPTQAQPMDDPSKGGMAGTTDTSMKTKTTDAIRDGLIKEKTVPAAVVNGLMIKDDGTIITLSGTVPDAKTHDAVLKSAKKTAGTRSVQDNLTVSGK
jgi:osmotically-inducible protein OsmY